MKSCAVLLAAGNSTRMGENKMLIKLLGKNPIERCIDVFSNQVDEIIIAVSENTCKAASEAAKSSCKPVKIVYGGKRRQDSVYNAITASDADIVCIHDCARCLVSAQIIKSSIESAVLYGSGITSVPVTDTIRNKQTDETLDRNKLCAAQTPQSFERLKLISAYNKAPEGSYTDDASVFSAAGNKLHYVEGSLRNMKLTYKTDIPLFEAVLRENTDMEKDKIEKMRIGFGEDTHRLQSGKNLVLGGALIPYEKGLEGHSDADVLTHAIIDAVLGACALGDIGLLFPDTDPRYEGISSIKLAENVSSLIKSKGFIIQNLDSTIIAQKPKLSSYREQMRSNIAKAFSIPIQSVSIKFSTPEKLGFEGRTEGITARASALVNETSDSENAF